jgi:hypothetical protein
MFVEDIHYPGVVRDGCMVMNLLEAIARGQEVIKGAAQLTIHT